MWVFQEAMFDDREAMFDYREAMFDEREAMGVVVDSKQKLSHF